MIGNVVPLAVLFAFFLLLRAFFAGSETALVSLNQVRIRRLAEEGNRRARIVQDLIDDPDRMLAMTLVGTNLMSVLIAQVGLAAMLVLLSGAEVAPLAATVATTVLVLIFGEILPKTLFRANAGELALRYAYPLRLFDIVLGLVARAVGLVTGFLVGILGRGIAAESPEAARAELRLLATLGERSGTIPRDQRRMIHGVLDTRDMRVERIMVPLSEIVAVDRTMDIQRFIEVAAESGYSRIPVYESQIYDIIGIVHILDVIHTDVEEGTIEPFIRRDIRFVPESKAINMLLKEMRRSPHTMVFAVDEHGGTVGLVTTEDLVEEIVGELSDERAVEGVRRIGSGMLECDGGTEIDTLIEEFGVRVPMADYDTIAGYILERTGAIPKPGDQVETEDLVITVLEADARSVRKVRIQSTGGGFDSP